MLVAAIPPPPFRGLEIGPLDLRMYGLLIAVGALLAVRLSMRRFERAGGDPEIAEKALLMALLVGFLGARIGYVIPRFTGPGGFAERPGDILAIWQGGLAFFGGLTGGALGAWLYVRRRGIPFAGIADAVAPALPLAQAIGRWGNYFNQELFGLPTSVPWALRVDPVPAATAARFPGASTFHPTFLYESLWNALLVVVILAVERTGRLKRRGSLLFVYLIGYGVGRGWIEALRVDTVERYLGLSRNNWIAIGVVVLGAVGLWWWERRPAVAPGDDARADDTPGAVAPGDDARADDTPGADTPADDTPAGESATAESDSAGDESGDHDDEPHPES
jgi:prolipoprotein diacylglyceryl transferase